MLRIIKIALSKRQRLASRTLPTSTDKVREPCKLSTETRLAACAHSCTAASVQFILQSTCTSLGLGQRRTLLNSLAPC